MLLCDAQPYELQDEVCLLHASEPHQTPQAVGRETDLEAVDVAQSFKRAYARLRRCVRKYVLSFPELPTARTGISIGANVVGNSDGVRRGWPMGVSKFDGCRWEFCCCRGGGGR